VAQRCLCAKKRFRAVQQRPIDQPKKMPKNDQFCQTTHKTGVVCNAHGPMCQVNWEILETSIASFQKSGSKPQGLFSKATDSVLNVLNATKFVPVRKNAWLSKSKTRPDERYALRTFQRSFNPNYKEVKKLKPKRKSF